MFTDSERAYRATKFTTCKDPFLAFHLENGGQGHLTKIAISQSFNEILTLYLVRLMASLRGHAVMMRLDDLGLKVNVK
jgi:hypothetical protein